MGKNTTAAPFKVWPIFESDFNSFADPDGRAWSVISESERQMWDLSVGSEVCIQDFEYKLDADPNLRVYGPIVEMLPAHSGARWVIWIA